MKDHDSDDVRDCTDLRAGVALFYASPPSDVRRKEHSAGGWTREMRTSVEYCGFKDILGSKLLQRIENMVTYGTVKGFEPRSKNFLLSPLSANSESIGGPFLKRR